MNIATTRFAREAGYTGNSPALLEAYEAIRQLGIKTARDGHYERKAVIPVTLAARLRAAQ